MLAAVEEDEDAVCLGAGGGGYLYCKLVYAHGMHVRQPAWAAYHRTLGAQLLLRATNTFIKWRRLRAKSHHSGPCFLTPLPSQGGQGGRCCLSCAGGGPLQEPCLPAPAHRSQSAVNIETTCS